MGEGYGVYRVVVVRGENNRRIPIAIATNAASNVLVDDTVYRKYALPTRQSPGHIGANHQRASITERVLVHDARPTGDQDRRAIPWAIGTNTLLLVVANRSCIDHDKRGGSDMLF